MKYTQGLLVILIIVEMLASIFIYQQSFNENTFCVTGGNCKAVQSSIYGSFLNVPLSLWGIIAFSILLILWYLSYKNKIKKIYFTILTTIAGLIAISLIFIQFFILKLICGNCLLVDTIAILIAIISLKEQLRC